MSILAIFRWQGDPKELLSSYDTELEHEAPRHQDQRISHICAGTDDGMVIVDVWKSEKAMRAMLDDPEFHRNMERAGATLPDTPEILPVHRSIP